MKHARVAVPVAALLLFAGCSTPSGGTAFSVAGQSVSQQQVDDAAEGCAPLAQQQVSAIRSQIATFLLLGKASDAISASTGVEVTPAMHSQAAQQMQAGELTSDPRCATAVNGVVNFGALANKLGQARTAQALKALDVQVNPRYGSWDPSAAALTGTSGSLSRQDMGLGKVFGG